MSKNVLVCILQMTIMFVVLIAPVALQAKTCKLWIDAIPDNDQEHFQQACRKSGVRSNECKSLRINFQNAVRENPHFYLQERRGMVAQALFLEESSARTISELRPYLSVFKSVYRRYREEYNRKLSLEISRMYTESLQRNTPLGKSTESPIIYCGPPYSQDWRNSRDGS